MHCNEYDVVVIGTGSMGAAACFYLSSRGCNVLGLEQFPGVPHENGSHSGQSRIIRKAYFEHKDYVPLLKRAYHLWDSFQTTTNERLYFRTGLLYAGPVSHDVIKGVKEAADSYDIELNPVQDFPFFTLPNQFESWMEPDAGFLLPEKTIQLFNQQAIQNGAEMRTSEKVISWEKTNNGFQVRTAKTVYYSRKIIITAGAWTSALSPSLNPLLKITRQVLIWVDPEKPELFGHENFPCWMIAGEKMKGVYYGFPYLSGDNFPGPAGLKFALHYPADKTDPDQVNRNVARDEIQNIIRDLGKYFPAANNKVVATKTCLYANSPDEDFIIDFLPGYDKDVIIACGFSGHGFKFVPVVGEILADLATNGKTKQPIQFLSLKRFQNT